ASLSSGRRNRGLPDDSRGRDLAHAGGRSMTDNADSAPPPERRAGGVARKGAAHAIHRGQPMASTALPGSERVVAEAGDVDLSRQDEAAIRAAFAHYAVLVFPGQSLDQEQHLAFTGLFGPHEKTISVHRKDMVLRLRPEIADISNLTVDNEIWGADSRRRMFQLGHRLWHTDRSFRHVPGYASALYSPSVAPIGGHTQFADMRAA